MSGAREIWGHLGLERHPFPNAPDAQAYFFTDRLLGEYEELKHCVLAAKGLMVLTGEVGTGKSTLLRRLLGDLQQASARTALIFNTFLQQAELLAAILRDFGLNPTGRIDADLEQLNLWLLDTARRGEIAVVVIDDAQNLSEASLETVRLLSNLETSQRKLIQIVLAGQPELWASLNRESLRQLRSRVVKHCLLPPLDDEELRRYLAFRLERAGASGRIVVEPGAQRALYRITRGNVRQVHLVMDRCLYALVAQHTRHVRADQVQQAAQELAQQPPSRTRGWWAGWRRGLVVAAGLGSVAAVTYAAYSWQFAQDGAPTAQPARAREAAAPAAPATQHLAQAADCRATLLADPQRRPLVRARPLPPPLQQWSFGATLCRADWGGQPWLLWTDTGDAMPDMGVLDARTLLLQRALASAGDLAPSAVDGRMGPRTLAALERRATAWGLGTGTDDLALAVLALVDGRISKEHVDAGR